VTESVVVVGSVNVDLIVRVPSLPHPGETVIGGAFHRAHGGKGANQAAAAARLGAETWIIACVGDDPFGAEARQDLESRGVRLPFLGRGKRPTGVAVITVDHSGQNAIAVASGANEELDADAVGRAIGVLDVPRAVVLANLEVSDDAVMAAAEAAEGRGWPFVLNPAPARPLDRSLVSRCHVLTPNEHEVRELGMSSVEKVLNAGADAVAVTRGAEGVDLHRPGRKMHHQPAFPVEVVDTTGAGDAFSATLAWGIAAGHTLEEAVRLAAAGAAFSTTALGARSSLADRGQVQQMLAASADLSVRG
jgi:ribokinase